MVVGMNTKEEMVAWALETCPNIPIRLLTALVESAWMFGQAQGMREARKTLERK